MRIRYALPFVHERTGERRTIVVLLAAPELDDVGYQFALRPDGAAAPGGPLERMYAWHRGARAVPEGFAPIYAEARRLELRAVND
jgi:hypothetical protein